MHVIIWITKAWPCFTAPLTSVLEYIGRCVVIDQDRVVSIRVHNNEIFVEMGDGQPDYTTLGVVNDEITQLVSDHGGIVTWGEPPRHLRTILTILLPLVLIGAFIWYFAKKLVDCRLYFIVESVYVPEKAVNAVFFTLESQMRKQLVEWFSKPFEIHAFLFAPTVNEVRR